MDLKKLIKPSELEKIHSTKLAIALRMAGFTTHEIKKLREYKKLPDIRLVVNGLAKIVPLDSSEIDPAIEIDRREVWPEPSWSKKVIFPELDNSGPDKYNVGELRQFLHPGQATLLTVKAQNIFDYLVGREMIRWCISVRDLIALKEKGLPFFRAYFGNIAVFAWRSARVRKTDTSCVPFIFEKDDVLVLRWCSFEQECNDRYVTLLLPKSEVPE